jgi:hypothetical protein
MAVLQEKLLNQTTILDDLEAQVCLPCGLPLTPAKFACRWFSCQCISARRRVWTESIPHSSRTTRLANCAVLPPYFVRFNNTGTLFISSFRFLLMHTFGAAAEKQWTHSVCARQLRVGGHDDDTWPSVFLCRSCTAGPFWQLLWGLLLGRKRSLSTNSEEMEAICFACIARVFDACAP